MGFYLQVGRVVLAKKRWYKKCTTSCRSVFGIFWFFARPDTRFSPKPPPVSLFENTIKNEGLARFLVFGKIWRFPAKILVQMANCVAPLQQNVCSEGYFIPLVGGKYEKPITTNFWGNSPQIPTNFFHSGRGLPGPGTWIIFTNFCSDFQVYSELAKRIPSWWIGALSIKQMRGGGCLFAKVHSDFRVYSELSKMSPPWWIGAFPIR